MLHVLVFLLSAGSELNCSGHECHLCSMTPASGRNTLYICVREKTKQNSNSYYDEFLLDGRGDSEKRRDRDSHSEVDNSKKFRFL